MEVTLYGFMPASLALDARTHRQTNPAVSRRAHEVLLLRIALVHRGAMGDLGFGGKLGELLLDREGALHIEERQHFVFSGDWNGGAS